MKKSVLPTIALLTSLLTAHAQYFSPTNLIVVQQGTTPSTGLGVTILQMQTNGTLVTTTNLPTSGANSFVLSTSTTEGFLSLSAKSNYMVLGGYNAAVGSSPSAATAAVAPRAAVTLDAYDNFSMPIKNTNIYSTFNIRGAVGDGLGNFWTSGSGGTGATIANGELGIVYVGTATSPTNVCVTETGTGNERCLEIYDGSLFLSTGSGSGQFGRGVYMISNVAGTYPVVTGSLANNTNVMQTGSGGGPYAFQINTAYTLAYLAEDNLGGIVKFTSTGPGGVWTSNYTLPVLTTGVTASSSTTNAYGCAVDWSQSPPVIYATTGESSINRLVRIVDTGAGATPTLLASAPASTAWRGVRFGPQLYGYVSVPPVPFAGNPGATATFSATVLGSPAPTLQWYSNSVANPTYVAILGATSTNLSLPGLTTAQNGSLFYLVASNVYGSSTNTPVLLTVNNPAISSEPVGATNFPNGPAVVLSVTASGTGTLSYQWLSNGVAIAGAQSSTYTVPSSAVSNTASYTVIVTNTGPGVTSITSAPPAIVVYTPYLLFDTFSYPNGNLFADAGSPWTDINGTNPELVTNGRVQISVSNATTDAQSLFTKTVNGTIVWASFTLNVSQLPSNAGGVYFANFEDTNFGFYGRLFLLTSNSPSINPGFPNIAYPGTYRLGIANGQNDSASSASTGPSAVVELDLAPGIDYQVVEYYDMANGFCQMAVNPSQAEASSVYFPAGPNALTSGYAQDSVAFSGLPMAAYGLRQRTGGGVMQMDNLEVSYDYTGFGSGFAAVTSGATITKATIGLLTPGVTNYAGNSNVLEVAASGIDLTYAWYQGTTALSDGGSVTGSATYALTLNPEVGTNTGNYTVVIANSAGSVTSSIVPVSINTTPTPPSFTAPGGLQPAATTTIAEGAKVTFTATAVGTGPITYAWNYNGTPNGATGSSLTLTGVSTNQAGTYTVTATGAVAPPATSANAILIVNGPVTANIHFLRSLISPSTFVVSDTTTLYTIQGTVVSATNLTSGTTASYYVQDSTGGINLFISGDATFRPGLGDIVNATGVLSVFGANLELDITAGAAFQTYTDLGAGSGLPAPAILPWNTAVNNPSSTVPTIEGSLVTMTNVYFQTAGNFTSATVIYPITNSSGQAFSIFVTGQPNNLQGLPIPAFAYSVNGIIEQTSATAYNLIVTRYADIVTAPPPAVNVTAALSGGTNVKLTWTSAPYQYTYSVLSSTNVAGPYTKLASGLLFTNASGSFTDVAPFSTTKFYEIVSP